MVLGLFRWALTTLDRFQVLVKIGLVLCALMMLGFFAATLWPGSTAKINRLGYHSICPFAPWSSLFFFVCAGLSLGFIPVVTRLVRLCRRDCKPE